MAINGTLLAVIASDYKNKVELFNKEVVKPGSIVLLGDSLFGFFNNKDYFNDKIINRGISGDTTKGVLERLDQIINIDPSVVIINIGSNDIPRFDDPADTITRRILQIKYELESNIKDVKVYILSLSPVLRDNPVSNMAYMRNRTNSLIMEVNDELNIYTDIIDVNGCLSDDNGNLRLEYTTDGLHLTKAGYDIFVRHMSKYIKELTENSIL